MTAAGLSALVPYLVLTGSLMVLLLVVSFRRSHALAMWLTVAALVATLATLPGANAVGTQHIDGFLTIDAFANFFNGLFALAGIVTALLAYRYLEGRSTHAHREEFYILLLTATLGAMTMASAAHFAAFLLGLEIVSISLYAMIAYPEQGQAPLEAALKYLVLSGVASTTMLFGMALVYASVGTMAFGPALGAGTDPLLIAGQVMILAGVAFKLSLVPFHMWTPDVYQGAPAPVTGFVATVSKGGVVAVLLRYVVETDMLSHETLFLAVSLIAIVSMVVGNLLALLQDNLKRILAYSSIAHIGYLLIAVLVVATLASPAMALETGMFYLAGYFLMTLAAFGVMTVLSTGASDGRGGPFGLRRTLLAPTRAGGRPHRRRAVAGGHPADRRLHRQVLSLRGGRRRRSLGTPVGTRRRQRHRHLLLPAHRLQHDPDVGRRSRRRSLRPVDRRARHGRRAGPRDRRTRHLPDTGDRPGAGRGAGVRGIGDALVPAVRYWVAFEAT